MSRRRPAGSTGGLKLAVLGEGQEAAGLDPQCRIDTAATKSAFRLACKKPRCLIPMAGHYERPVSPRDRKKDPLFIRATGLLLAAGLWEAPHCPTAIYPCTRDTCGLSTHVPGRVPAWLQASQINE